MVVSDCVAHFSINFRLQCKGLEGSEVPQKWNLERLSRSVEKGGREKGSSSTSHEILGLVNFW